MSQLLAEDRRRLLEASSRPSPLHVQNPSWIAPPAAASDSTSPDAFASDPKPTVAAATGPAALFSVHQLARFSPEVKEELLLEDIRGTLAQFRSPAFPMANAILKTLHTSVEAPSSESARDNLNSQQMQSDDGRVLPAKAMVVDIHDAALCGALSQTGSGGLVLRQSAQVRVTRATIESLGVAFGHLVAYPHSEVVRIKLIPSCGGIDILARCFDSEPLQNGELVMLTVEPGCIRVHCARPKKAQGHWQIAPGDKAAEPASSLAEDPANPTTDGAELKTAGGKVRRRRRGAGKDQLIVDELSLVPLTADEKLALLEKKKAAKRQREETDEVAAETEPQAPNVVVVISGGEQESQHEKVEKVEVSASRLKVKQQESSKQQTFKPAAVVAPQPTATATSIPSFVIPGKKGKGITTKGSKTVLNDSDDD